MDILRSGELGLNTGVWSCGVVWCGILGSDRKGGLGGVGWLNRVEVTGKGLDLHLDAGGADRRQEFEDAMIEVGFRIQIGRLE